jgi:23S rRNA C2498 (ribose-2'-O)-methylase RlmM
LLLFRGGRRITRSPLDFLLYARREARKRRSWIKKLQRQAKIRPILGEKNSIFNSTAMQNNFRIDREYHNTNSTPTLFQFCRRNSTVAVFRTTTITTNSF